MENLNSRKKLKTILELRIEHLVKQGGANQDNCILSED